MSIDLDTTRSRLLDTALPEVAATGWETAYATAVRVSDVDHRVANRACPGGGIDLALAYHDRLDHRMIERLAAGEGEGGRLRIRDRVARAVRVRLELADRDIVRRSAGLFALPQNAGRGAAAVWKTADAIWVALNDPSNDVNWYSKRFLLSGILSSTVLYWIRDDSPGQEASWAFLDRRIGDVMQIESAKARIRKLPGYREFMAGPGRILGLIRAPSRNPPDDLPGYWTRDPGPAPNS